MPFFGKAVVTKIVVRGSRVLSKLSFATLQSL